MTPVIMNAMEMTAISLLAFGLLLGARHAFEIDHIAAVSTIVSRQKSVKKSALSGMFWGFGHTIALFLAGLIVLSLKAGIPNKIALSLEIIVGVMLVLLGLDALRKINRNRMHVHKHRHGSMEHIHIHSHRLAKSHKHGHLAFKKSLLVGLVHGLAGSAAITLLVLASIKSFWLGMIYILIFGTGSIIGMALLSSLISLPFALISLQKQQKMLSTAAGLLSLVIGLGMIYSIGLF